MGGGLLNKVRLGLLLSAQDDGLEGAVRAALEQVNALREGMEALAKVEDPLAPFLKSLEAMRAPLGNAVQQLVDLKAAMADMGGAEGIKVTVNDAAALATIETLTTQADAMRKAADLAMEPVVNAQAAREQLDGLTKLADTTRQAVDAAMAPVVNVQPGKEALDALVKQDAAARADMEKAIVPLVDDKAALDALAQLRQTGIEDLDSIAKQAAMTGESAERSLQASVDAQQASLNALSRTSQEVSQAIQDAFDTAARDLQLAMDQATSAVEADLSAMSTRLAEIRAEMAGLGAPALGAGSRATAGVVLPGIPEPATTMDLLQPLGANLPPPAEPGGIYALEPTQMGLPDFQAQVAKEQAAMEADMATMQTALHGAAADVQKGGGGFFGFGGGAMNLAMNAFMAQQGLQMVTQSAMGMVGVSNLLSSYQGMSAPEAEQLSAALGVFGIAPTADVSTLQGLMSGVQQATTITGGGTYSKSTLLALQALSDANLPSMPKWSGGGTDIVAALRDITSPENMLATFSTAYENLTSSGQTTQAANLLGGFGLGSLAPLIANYGPVRHDLLGTNLGLSPQQIQQQASQGLDLAVEAQKLDLEFMALATTAAPGLEAALKLVEDAANAAAKAINAIDKPGAAQDAAIVAASAVGLNMGVNILKTLLPAAGGAAGAAAGIGTDALAGLGIGAGAATAGAGAIGAGIGIADISAEAALLVAKSIPSVDAIGRGIAQAELAASTWLRGLVGGQQAEVQNLFQAGLPTVGQIGTGPMQAFQQPYTQGGHTYYITVNVPGGTSAAVRGNMESLAQQIVTNLRLAKNIELTG